MSRRDPVELSDAAKRALSLQSYAPEPEIEGVQLVELQRFTDDGGSFLELGRLQQGLVADLPGFECRQINYSELDPGTIKAFHLHRRQTDVWFVPPDDKMLVVMIDVRAGSKSRDAQRRVILGDGRARLLRIPPGVAHGVRNLAPACPGTSPGPASGTSRGDDARRREPVMKILVTGGAGFIGSNFVRHLLTAHPEDSVVNLDKLTYAGNLENLRDVEADPRYRFLHGDICDRGLVREAMHGVDAVVHFAAETHVDRSNLGADEFLRTNVTGTFVLLEAARERQVGRFLSVSTDEVYGSIIQGAAREDHRLNPSNPYSASKAAADLLVGAYWTTHRLPVLITRSSNNFGPYQYPEKVIPLFVTNALEDKPLPLYGDGRNVRDWLYVLDNCAAIDLVLRRGRDGEIYNIGGGTEVENIALTRRILQLLGKPESLITPVTDRPGHDRRYALDSAKVRALGWAPAGSFEAALAATVEWYRAHEGWWKPIKSGAFRQYYRTQYAAR
jgi:dTDP-glucose 4,6-dehydratase